MRNKNEGLKDGAVLHQPPKYQSKRKRKAANRPDSSSKKRKNKHGHLKPLNHFSKYIKEYKTKCEFNVIDFEPDLLIMYTDGFRFLQLKCWRRYCSPRDNCTHVKGGLSFVPSRRVTLPPCKLAIRSIACHKISCSNLGNLQPYALLFSADSK